MNSQLRSHLAWATLSTFEDLGFVLPVPQVDEAQAAIELAWAARVTFDGPVCGHLELRATNDVANELAANMLGVAEAPEESLKCDALGELANVICGNVVPSLAGPRDIFDLERPEASAYRPDRADEDEDSEVVLELGVESGRVEVALWVRDRDAA